MDFFQFYTNFLSMADYVTLFQDYRTIVLASAIAFLCIFVFEAIGLYTIAKRESNKHKWFAFVPFLNDELLGELGGTGYLFSLKIKKTGLWLAIVDLVGTILSAFLYVCEYLVRTGSVYENGMYVSTPAELLWAYRATEFGQYLEMIIEMVYIIFLVVALIAFFRRYFPRNYMILTVTAFLIPISKGIMIFVLRKNKGVDFQEYMRKQREAYMRQYGQQSRFDRNPYDPFSRPNETNRPNDPFNPYNGNDFDRNGSYHGAPYRTNEGNGQGAEIDPFEEFSSSPRKEQTQQPEQTRPFDPNDDGFFN